MTGVTYRFGPFLLSRAEYRLDREGRVVDLTPKLLDLLLHLAEHAGELVTKEALLDALWPDANVTENALAQAVSELRNAIGDEPGDARYIKTVARRGYRFIARVERIETTTQPVVAPDRSTGTGSAGPDAARDLAVMDFVNVSGDPDLAWLAAGIAETVTADLQALGRFRVIDRWRVVEAMLRAGGSVQALAADVGARFAVVGSYQRTNDRIRITSRLLDITAGDALADAKVDGSMGNLFDLQDEIVRSFATDLHLAPGGANFVRGSARETSSLEAYRALTEGWMKLEGLDVHQLESATADFERAVSLDPRYALAHAGLANALYARYEATRSDVEPSDSLLERAIDQARHAIELEDGLAEAHATLAMVLVSAWQTPEAVAAARRAVTMEPSNWRHLFRLGHASWGEARLQAAAGTLALYPDFAFAHFQIAMVYVARGHLSQADTVLQQGANVQDRQIGRRERYPPLGLHWLRGLVHLAGDALTLALGEFEAEIRQAEDPRRLYGREYQMAALHGRGVAFLHAGDYRAAEDALRSALALYPHHAPSRLVLALVLRALDAHGDAEREIAIAREEVGRLVRARPFDGAISAAALSVVDGELEAAEQTLSGLVADAPPGFAGWTLPIEPLLRQLHGRKGFAASLTRLADRAR